MSFLNAYDYFLNPFAAPVLAVSTLLLLVGIFVLTQNPKSSRNISFFIICMSSCIWLYGISLVYCSRYEALALNWYKYFAFFGVAHIAPSIYFFSVAWAGWSVGRKRWIAIGYATALFFFLSSALTRHGIVGARRYFWGFYPIYGPIATAFVAFFVLYYSMALRNFLLGRSREIRPRFRKQYDYMIIAYLITFFGACDFIPKFSAVPLYPFGYITVLSWLLIVAYSIVRYKLMDIETVIHKTLIWAALSSLVFLPLGLTVYCFKDLFLYIHPILSSVFGVGLFCLFMIYAKTIQPWIDHIFQRRKYDLEKELIKFSENLVYLKNLEELAHYIVQTLRDVLYVDQVQIFLKHGGNTSLIRIDAETDGSAEPSYNNTFIRWLEEQDEVALVDFVDIDPRFERVKDQAKRFFEGLGVRVAVPLVLNRELIGLINLGQKANLKPFRSAEVMFLSEFRRAATIALSNSLRLIEMHENLQKWNEELEEKVRQRTQELEDAQKQLIQAEKLATLGTLAGGVAHEINNPLTAILTNIQLLKLDVKDERETESIDLIEEGAKRCREIIQKIMKYARKSDADVMTEKIDLNRVVENTISFLEYQLKQENVEVSMENSGDAPYVSANNSELAQVLTNLILNAKDAVENTGRMGKIQIETFASNGAVGFKVKDNGHGIPKENMNRIFDPFFTTKDVGKGTGLGLAVTYGIVKKYNGDIGVESKLGAGTTFTVTFPKPN